MNPSNNAVEIKDLRIDYGDKVAVDDLNLTIESGEIFGLLGPNGAGKTSTFRVLATLQEPTYGDVFVQQVDIAEHPEKVRHQMGYMPDFAPVPSDLKVWEFLDMFAASHGLPSAIRKQRIEECLEAVQLQDSRNVYCKTLSRGMTQRAVLARNLLHQPEVLILDEPASGMDPVSRASLWKTLRDLADQGCTIIISSHILRDLSELCTKVAILNKGKLLDTGPVQQVIDRLSNREVVNINIRIKQNAEKALSILQSNTKVADINQTDGEFLVAFSGNEDDQVALLESLMSEPCKVLSFAPEQATIEEVLLNLS